MPLPEKEGCVFLRVTKDEKTKNMSKFGKRVSLRERGREPAPRKTCPHEESSFFSLSPFASKVPSDSCSKCDDTLVSHSPLAKELIVPIKRPSTEARKPETVTREVKRT